MFFLEVWMKIHKKQLEKCQKNCFGESWLVLENFFSFFRLSAFQHYMHLCILGMKYIKKKKYKYFA